MHRNSIRDMAFRTFHTLARSTVNSVKDNPMMQEMSSDFMNNDSRKGKLERVQNYGFTSTILPRDEKEGGDKQASGGGGGGDGGGGGTQPEQEKGEAAEALIMFVGGQRNHPVAVGVDDRRHRPRNMKPGENAQYDDIGQMTLMRRTGLYLLSLDSEDKTDKKSKGEKKERMVSMRHVEKKKQERPKPQQQGSGGGGQQQEQQEEDFKHEGESVNTEVRCTKKKISFFSGEDEVGYYDKENKRWVFIGEVKLGSADASHPVYGVVGGVGKTTVPAGDGAVLVVAPRPGPPTSQDTAP